MTKPTKWHVCPHPSSLISLRCAHNGQVRTQVFFVRTTKTDQTGQIPRLIWIFTGRTGHFVGFPCCGSYFKQSVAVVVLGEVTWLVLGIKWLVQNYYSCHHDKARDAVLGERNVVYVVSVCQVEEKFWDKFRAKTFYCQSNPLSCSVSMKILVRQVSP